MTGALYGRQGLTWYRHPLDEVGIKIPSDNVFGHTGGDPGVFTIVMFNPVKQSGLVFLMNESPEINLRLTNLILMMHRLIREANL